MCTMSLRVCHKYLPIFVYVDGVNVETGKDERETMKSEDMKTVKIAIGFLLLMLGVL